MHCEKLTSKLIGVLKSGQKHIFNLRVLGVFLHCIIILPGGVRKSAAIFADGYIVVIFPDAVITLSNGFRVVTTFDGLRVVKFPGSIGVDLLLCRIEVVEPDVKKYIKNCWKQNMKTKITT